MQQSADRTRLAGRAPSPPSPTRGGGKGGEARPLLASRFRPRLKTSESLLGILLMLPAVVSVAFLLLYPLVDTLRLSFFYQNLARPDRGTPFVGLDNFIWLAQYELFWKALTNSVVLVVGTVGIELMLGLGIASLLNLDYRGRFIVRWSFIMPWVVPTFVAAFAWQWILHPQFGSFNHFLVAIGLAREGVSILGNPRLAMIGVIVVTVWKRLPWVVLVLLAGLQTIPNELREAAKVDGANRWQEFWHITLPGLRFVISMVVLLRTIWTFNDFDLVFLLTAGGPNDATLVLPVLLQNVAFVGQNLGRAAALGFVMFIVLAGLTVAWLKSYSREVER
ncbi:MAG: sugar ABC transporter permease [Chloroflexi bacterium]|nr:sugar ABC transporter permease [Chloroflexota bacterium]